MWNAFTGRYKIFLLLSSALSFFILSSHGNATNLFAMALSFIGIYIVLTRTMILNVLKGDKVPLRLFYLLSTIGIVYANFHYFLGRRFVIALANSVPHAFIFLVGLLLSAFSIPFIYFLVKVFWQKLWDIFFNTHALSMITRREKLLYFLMLSVMLVFMGFSFFSSNAFYGIFNSVIYSSDSGFIVQGNSSYLVLITESNDLRQPLFAIFSAPFVCIPYLIGQLVSGLDRPLGAFLINVPQIVLLLLANYLLALSLKLTEKQRVGFMIIMGSTYTTVLSSIMMEQYIFAYFWLVLSIYTILNCKNVNYFSIWGACGTLIISVFLFLAGVSSKCKGLYKDQLKSLIRWGGMLLLFIIICGRFDVIWNGYSRLQYLWQFTGEGVSIEDRIYQYASFVYSCFLAPETAIVWKEGNFAWKLVSPTTLNMAGVLIFALAIIGFVLNRHIASANIAFLWLMLSVFILVIVGWGTAENGLILYSLYFGWAFLVLLFQLIKYFEKHFRIPNLSLVSCIIISIYLLFVNIPAMFELINFAVAYYPVK